MAATSDGAAEPTLVEAFSDFASGIAEAEEQGGEVARPSDNLEQATEAGTDDDAHAAAPAAAEGDTRAPVQDTDPLDQAGRAAPKGGEPRADAAPAEGGQAAAAEPAPLTYQVNGQTRAFEGGYSVPGQGLIFTEEARARVLDTLQRADRLSVQNQQLYERTVEYDKLGGRAAYDKLSSEKAMLDASATLLLRALSDENTLVALATDPVARQQLIKEIHLTAREAQMTAQRESSERWTRETTQARTATDTQTAIFNAVGQIAQQFEGLTADDVQAVRSHAGRMHTAIVRPATPDEARVANVQVGSPIIDLPLLHSLLSDRHALRQSAVQAAQRRQTDTRENAARAAAAAPTTVNGKAPSPPRSGPGRTAPTSAKKRIDELSSNELKRAMLSGRIIDLLNAEDDEKANT